MFKLVLFCRRGCVSGGATPRPLLRLRLDAVSRDYARYTALYIVSMQFPDSREVKETEVYVAPLQGS